MAISCQKRQVSIYGALLDRSVKFNLSWYGVGDCIKHYGGKLFFAEFRRRGNLELTKKILIAMAIGVSLGAILQLTGLTESQVFRTMSWMG